MLKDFFKLNSRFEEFDEERMSSQIKTSKHIVNVLYRPDELKEKRLMVLNLKMYLFQKRWLKNVHSEIVLLRIACLLVQLSMKLNFTSAHLKTAIFLNRNFLKFMAGRNSSEIQ